MTLRVGFLGHGFAGRAHANALDHLPMAVPDCPPVERRILIGPEEGPLAVAADRLGFAETTTDWRAALGEIDVLCNLAPNHLHAEPSIAALEQGVHVLCEKPLAHTLEAAEQLAEAARASDALASIAFNYRFVPAIQRANELIDAGEIGEPRHVRARYLQDWMADPSVPWSWRTDESRAGSGALADIGAHLFDLARFLTEDVERVTGRLQTVIDERPVDETDETRPVTVDDAFTAQVTFESGAAGTVEASRVAPGHKNDLVIAIDGTDGSIRFSLERLNELQIHRPGTRGFEHVLVTDPSDPWLDAWWPPGHVLGWEHTFVHQYTTFLAGIVDGTDPGPDFEDGLRTQRILDAIERSHRTGGWVDLE